MPRRTTYASNGGDGTVSIIQQESPDNYRVVETVKTAPGARNMALDLKTKKIFLPLSDREPPPPPTAQTPNPRDNVIPGSFRVRVFAMAKSHAPRRPRPRALDASITL